MPRTVRNDRTPQSAGGSRRRRWRVVAGASSLAAGTALLLLPSMTASAASPPTAYGAETEGKALYQNYNAVAAVDPALPGSRAAVQVDPSASPQVLITTYGYANDPGTLAGAVLFAPGNPTTPSNFPGLAEAFYPVPDQEHVAKCAANNDASNTTGSGACDQANTGTWYAVADASPKNPLGPSGRGFASEQGANIAGSPFTGSNLTSESNVTPDQDGNLAVIQENKGSNIAIAGTPLVASFEASSHLKSTTSGVTGSATCTINFTMGGQAVPVDQAAQVLNQAGTVPGSPYSYQFTPPTPPVIDSDSLGATASCTGAVLQVVDHVSNSSATYTFGTTVAHAATLGQTLSNSSGGSSSSSSSSSDVSSSGGTAGFTGSDSSGSSGGTASLTSGSSSAPSSDVAAPSTAAPSDSTAAPAAAAPQQSAPQQTNLDNGPRLITKKVKPLPIGIVTALGTLGILLGSWFLLSSVAGLGRHGVRLAGWR